MNCCKICSLLLGFLFIAGSINAQSILSSESTSTEKIFTEDTQNIASEKKTNCDPAKCAMMSAEKCSKLCPPKCCVGAKAASAQNIASEQNIASQKCCGIFSPGCCVKTQNVASEQNAASSTKACSSARKKCCKKGSAKGTALQIAEVQ